MNDGFCIWFTGLSGAGKSTLAKLLEDSLLERGLRVEVLDGDAVRTNLSKGLGFSREDRETNLRRIAFVANLLSRNGVAVIAAAISPYQSIRDEVRGMVHNFVEVFINCPVEVCIERDPKGLYKKALSGELKHFTGIDDPFEPPLKPEVDIRTAEETPQESLNRLLMTLEILRLIPAMPGQGYSDEEAAVLQKRLKDLGYI